ncbi:VCBS repeat-containing protein [Chryseolinea lacunae]|uniref:VCBS repeat-containing protein n=1 Tax=Chryseolinea lacunae TaxID=2801331 RepID=A0ABS1L1E6_9BACT|nr:VCBS repeat-containing protein [Chryseolinea lacunae]MBL0745511.1 VCBS repeat-containing protein [Chryseolinea lacunae]
MTKAWARTLPQPLFFLALLLSLAGCQPKPAVPPALFTLVEPGHSGVSFTNTIAEDDTFNIVDFYYVYNGGGVAIGDINNDSLPDLYFTGNRVGDRLYVNKGNLKFEDVTSTAGIRKRGWSTGVTMVDINADGLLDIYVCKSGNYPAAKRINQLYINEGNLKFREDAAAWGLADTTYTNQAAFFDYDKDGDLDVYLLTSTNTIRNPNKVTPVVDNGKGPSVDKLLRNDNGKFVDVSASAGILHEGFGLGVAINDLNDDGWEDILVSNDFLANDHLYVNNHDGTFTESARKYFKHHSQFSMGNDVSDFNNDGLADVMVVDMLPAAAIGRKKMAGPANPNTFEAMTRAGYHPQYMRNVLQVNLGFDNTHTPVFAEIGQQAGVHSTDWSWAPLFADFDQDGRKDLFITNGYLRDITDMDFIIHNNQTATQATPAETDRGMREGAKKMPSKLMRNYMFRNAGDNAFEDLSAAWLGAHPSLSNGASLGDLDLDGDLDIVVNNINEPAFIFQNTIGNAHYLKVILNGNQQNTKGLGSDITLYANGELQRQHMSVTRGYQSSLDYGLHFGLGKNTVVDSLQIIWPDGKSQVMRNVKADRTITLSYADSGTEKLHSIKQKSSILHRVDSAMIGAHREQEKFYMDYDVEPLLPHKLSQQGPCLAVADVNKDGLDDFFVGGSYQYTGNLFLQQANGTFKVSSIGQDKKNEEDTGATFFDADHDGDQDLYIVSGSNEHYDNSPYLQDRLLLNNGKGKFTPDTTRLPAMRHSGSCVVPFDFDKDGDLDLFRAGRLIPLEFPKPGVSYLLTNTNGKFTDDTNRLAAGLQTVGMVTDALWADIDGDGWHDLVLVGEYMPITIFKNDKGTLNQMKPAALEHSNGLWNTLAATDIDHDGDVDFVVGNVGLNSRYRFTKEQPFSIYGGDLDNNNRWDAIPAYYDKGIEYPVSSWFDLGRQVPLYKKKYQTFDAYAKATLTEAMAPVKDKVQLTVHAYQQQSVIVENLGHGEFNIRPLPALAQRAPIKDILVRDINQDGHDDLLLVGNDFTTEPVEGQHDAGVGAILLGDGKGTFKPMPSEQSGFWVEYDARHLEGVKQRAGEIFVVTQNNGPLLMFQKK